MLVQDMKELYMNEGGGEGFADRQGAAPFGRVVSGLDVVRRIQLEPSADGALMPPVSILRASRVR